MQTIPLLAVLTMTAMPPSVAKLGTKEEESDPLVTLLNVEETQLTQPVRLLVDVRTPTTLPYRGNSNHCNILHGRASDGVG